MTYNLSSWGVVFYVKEKKRWLVTFIIEIVMIKSIGDNTSVQTLRIRIVFTLKEHKLRRFNGSHPICVPSQKYLQQFRDRLGRQVKLIFDVVIFKSLDHDKYLIKNKSITFDYQFSHI